MIDNNDTLPDYVNDFDKQKILNTLKFKIKQTKNTFEIIDHKNKTLDDYTIVKWYDKQHTKPKVFVQEIRQEIKDGQKKNKKKKYHVIRNMVVCDENQRITYIGNCNAEYKKAISGVEICYDKNNNIRAYKHKYNETNKPEGEGLLFVIDKIDKEKLIQKVKFFCKDGNVVDEKEKRFYDEKNREIFCGKIKGVKLFEEKIISGIQTKYYGIEGKKEKKYYQDEKITKIENYLNNKLITTTFYNNGEKKYKITHNDGNIIEYNKNGNTTFEGKYKEENGKIIKIEGREYKNNNTFEGTFENGKRYNGIESKSLGSGDPTRFYIYKKGKRTEISEYIKKSILGEKILADDGTNICLDFDSNNTESIKKLTDKEKIYLKKELIKLYKGEDYDNGTKFTRFWSWFINGESYRINKIKNKLEQLMENFYKSKEDVKEEEKEDVKEENKSNQITKFKSKTKEEREARQNARKQTPNKKFKNFLDAYIPTDKEINNSNEEIRNLTSIFKIIEQTNGCCGNCRCS